MDQLAQEMEKLMCSILEQGLLIDQELATRANLDANDDRANADMSATDPPP